MAFTSSGAVVPMPCLLPDGDGVEGQGLSLHTVQGGRLVVQAACSGGQQWGRGMIDVPPLL